MMYAWILEDEYEEMQPDYFCFEIQNNEIPYPLQKYLRSMDTWKAVRLEIKALEDEL